MAHLHAILAAKVKEWRKGGFVNEDFPAISELLEHQLQEDDDGLLQSRFLRAAQFDALCTYWYLRLVVGTPHVRDLYLSLFPKKTDLIEALGLKDHEGARDYLFDNSVDSAVFDICLSDIPSRKTDLIDATYELPAPDGKTTVAVKIIDMLGEEVLLLKEIG